MARWAVTLPVGGVAACSLPAAASASVAGDASTPAAGVPNAMGLLAPQPKVVSAATDRGRPRGGRCAARERRPTPYAMPVNQGQVGSCAAWASDYSALGYWENKEGIAGGGLEPMYP